MILDDKQIIIPTNMLTAIFILKSWILLKQAMLHIKTKHITDKITDVSDIIEIFL